MKQSEADFRYQVLAPLLLETEVIKSKEQWFQEAAAKVYEFNGMPVELRPGLIKSWYHRHRKHGMDGLKGQLYSIHKVRANEILRLYFAGVTQREISACTMSSNRTVSKLIACAKEHGVSVDDVDVVSDDELHARLFPTQGRMRHCVLPDFDKVTRELPKKGVTRKRLWEAYRKKACEAGERAYGYEQYCTLLLEYQRKNSATMVMNRRAGERLEVDWAGETLTCYDEETGELVKAYIFVGVMAYSNYFFVYATPTMKSEDWIEAHVNMFDFFEVVPRILCPDNCKTAVLKNTKSELVLQRNYRQLGEHYSVSILPARPYKPRDKSIAELTVKLVTMHIIAEIKSEPTYTSFKLLNERIVTLTEVCNQMPFQRQFKDNQVVSRESKFYEEEYDGMRKIPTIRFELPLIKQLTVSYNYHVNFGNENYSVPYEYIQHRVDVHIFKKVIKIYYSHKLVATHDRIRESDRTRYRTEVDHMPREHQEYQEWNDVRFISWAASIGPSTHTLISRLFEHAQVIEHQYKTAMSILGYSKQYNKQILEQACTELIGRHAGSHSAKSVRTVILEMVDATSIQTQQDGAKKRAMTHGKSYYSGVNK